MGHLRAWGADGGLGIGLGVQMGNMPAWGGCGFWQQNCT